MYCNPQHSHIKNSSSDVDNRHNKVHQINKVLFLPPLLNLTFRLHRSFMEDSLKYQTSCSLKTQTLGVITSSTRQPQKLEYSEKCRHTVVL